MVEQTYGPRNSFFFPFFFPSHLLSSPFYSLPPSRNSDPGSHNRLFSPPTHYGSCLAFLSREDFCSFFLVDSRRIVLTHARRSQQLILFCFVFANKFKISHMPGNWLEIFSFLPGSYGFSRREIVLNKNDFIELYSWLFFFYNEKKKKGFPRPTHYQVQLSVQQY